MPECFELAVAWLLILSLFAFNFIVSLWLVSALSPGGDGSALALILFFLMWLLEAQAARLLFWMRRLPG